MPNNFRLHRFGLCISSLPWQPAIDASRRVSHATDATVKANFVNPGLMTIYRLIAMAIPGEMNHPGQTRVFFKNDRDTKLLSKSSQMVRDRTESGITTFVSNDSHFLRFSPRSVFIRSRKRSSKKRGEHSAS